MKINTRTVLLRANSLLMASQIKLNEGQKQHQVFFSFRPEIFLKLILENDEREKESSLSYHR